MARIFISYSRVDKPFVEKLYNQLESVYSAGSVWYDKEILGGEDFWERICREIDRADVSLYLLSPESIASTWCNAEYDEADRLNKAIIPIIVRDRTPIISKVQHLNVLNMSSGAEDTSQLNKLYQTINPLFYSKPTEPQPPKNLRRTSYPGERQDMVAVPDHGQNLNLQQLDIQGDGNQVKQTQNISTGIGGRWLFFIVLIVVIGFAVFFIFTRQDETPPVTLAYEFLVDTSGLMNQQMGNIRRLNIVTSAIGQIVETFPEDEAWRALRVAGGSCDQTEHVISGTNKGSEAFVQPLQAIQARGVNAYQKGIEGLTRDLSEEQPRTSDIRVAFLFLGSIDASPCEPVNFAEQFDKFAQYNISTTLCTFALIEDEEKFERFKHQMISSGFTCVHNETDPQEIASIALRKMEELIQIQKGEIETLTPFPTSTDTPTPQQEIPVDGTVLALNPTATETSAPIIVISQTPVSTSTAIPTETPTPTDTLSPTTTFTPTLSNTESVATLTALNVTIAYLTSTAGVPQTQSAQTASVIQTADQVATNKGMTQEAMQTLTQNANIEATQTAIQTRQIATDNAIASARIIATEQQATRDVVSTQEAEATAIQQNINATQDAIQTENANATQAQQNIQATGNASSTQSAIATQLKIDIDTATAQFISTQNTKASETQISLDATATADSWTPIPSPTATDEPGIILTSLDAVYNIRGGPGIDYDIVAEARFGRVYLFATAIIKGTDNNWWIKVLLDHPETSGLVIPTNNIMDTGYIQHGLITSTLPSLPEETLAELDLDSTNNGSNADTSTTSESNLTGGSIESVKDFYIGQCVEPTRTTSLRSGPGVDNYRYGYYAYSKTSEAVFQSSGFFQEISITGSAQLGLICSVGPPECNLDDEGWWWPIHINDSHGGGDYWMWQGVLKPC